MLKRLKSETNTAEVIKMGNQFAAVEYKNGLVVGQPKVFDTLREADLYLVGRNWMIEYSDQKTTSSFSRDY